MNTPNPLVPQGSFLEKGKSHIKITVLAILAIHVVLLGVLLIAGCNKKTSTDQAPDAATGVPAPAPSPEPWPAVQTSTPPAQLTQPVAPPPEPPPLSSNITPPAPTPPPPPPPAPEPTPAPAGLTEHTIVKGESFYTLGKKYGVGFKAIAEANPGINPNRLKIGDKVKIPAPRSGASSALGAPGSGSSGPADGVLKTYKVKSGDNLMKIAKAHGVNVKLLRSANNLKTDQIKVGQTLKIPAKAAPAAPALESLPTAPPPVAAPAPASAPAPTANP